MCNRDSCVIVCYTKTLLFFTSNQRLYNHDITHSTTLSMAHFRDTAWVTIFVTLHRCAAFRGAFHDVLLGPRPLPSYWAREGRG